MGFDVKTRVNKLLASAKKRNIPVNLCLNKYQNLINNGCHYCGTELSSQNGYCLDRVDSQKGYTITNVVPCCSTCNRAKGTMEIFEFVEWLNKANTHTTKVLEMIKEFEASGGYHCEKEEMAAHEQANKGLPKARVKFVPEVRRQYKWKLSK